MNLLNVSFVLIRHGQTDANRDGRVAGCIEATLTEVGRDGARQLVGWGWPKDIALFASPQQRARETARLGFPDHEPILLEGIRERNWGEYEGRPVSEIRSRAATPEQGEAWAEVIDRVARSIVQAQHLAAGRLPVLVAHSGVIRAARELTGHQAWGEAPANTTPYLFSPGPDGWSHAELARHDRALMA